jgi:DNA-directed RNA polymerase specialized sigma24 family protein
MLRKQAEQERLARNRRDAEKVKQIELQQIEERYLPQLDEIYREAMQLVVFEELTYGEAAEKAGVGLSCMKVRVMRARQQVGELRMNDETRRES